MQPAPVRVYLILPGKISREQVDRSLTDDEKERAGRFKFPKDAVQWSACRAGLRQILGRTLGLDPLEVPIQLSSNGKPELATPYQHIHFNLSHCDGLALVAVSQNSPVGIDLEPQNRAETLLECESTFCHPEEINSLPEDQEKRARHLLRIWIAKEAVLKALGTGLTHPPESVTLHFQSNSGRATSGIPLQGVGNLLFHELSHPRLEGFQAMIALSTKECGYEICD